MPDAVCSHCQQCAEKYLKAYLIMQSAVPDRTHDLEKLLRDCAAYDTSCLSLLPLMDTLNRYSVDPRYPGITATVAEAQEAARAARRIRRVLRRKMGL